MTKKQDKKFTHDLADLIITSKACPRFMALSLTAEVAHLFLTCKHNRDKQDYIDSLKGNFERAINFASEQWDKNEKTEI